MSSEKECSFSAAGSLDLDEDDAKARCVYSSRVVTLSLVLRVFLQVIPFSLAACLCPLFPGSLFPANSARLQFFCICTAM